MEYLNPNNPDDLKIILDDQIDNMLEQISPTELFELLIQNKELKEINNISHQDLVFILNPSSNLDQTSVGYLFSFWQQIYFDYFDH